MSLVGGKEAAPAPPAWMRKAVGSVFKDCAFFIPKFTVVQSLSVYMEKFLCVGQGRILSLEEKLCCKT